MAAFRIASFAWMLGFNFVTEQFRSVLLAAAALGAAGVWTAWLARRPARQERSDVLWIDLALSTGLILISAFVVHTGKVASGRLFFATAYPVSTALMWGMARGTGAGLITGVVLSLALIATRPLNGITYRELSQVVSVLNGAVYYLMAGGTMGLISRQLDQAAARVGSTVKVAIAERERVDAAAEIRETLARRVHDTVLQGLAMVAKQAREMGEQGVVSGDAVRGLGDRVDHEARVLRRTIMSEPDTAPSEGLVKLRDTLEALALQNRVVPVEVQATGPVWAPARQAQVIVEATREALNNVEKASRATRALIRAEISQGWIVVSVRDNGRGFIYEEGKGGYGIANSMKGPVEAIGGTFRLVSAPDLGCDVEFRVPADIDGRVGGSID